MSSRSFKFRYVHEITGAFVLLAIGVVVAAVVAAGRVQDWFETVRTYRLVVPAALPSGVHMGADVQVGGTPVGSVERIDLSPEGDVEAVIEVRGDLHRFIRDGSHATVRKRFFLAGDAYVEITHGDGPVLRDGAVIPYRHEEDLGTVVQGTFAEFRELLRTTLEQMNRLIPEYTRLAEGLRDPQGPLQSLLDRLNVIAAALADGQGAVGRLIADPELAATIAQTVDDAHAAVVELDGILAHVQEATAGLPGIVETVGSEVADAPGLVIQLQATTRELELLIEGLQRHWLIRGYIDQTSPGRPLAPAALDIDEGGP